MRKWIGKSEGSVPQKQSKLIEKETTVIKVKYETKGLWNIDIAKDDITYQELQIPDIGQNIEPGEPSLPQEGLYVAIPDDATVTDIKVSDTRKKVFKLSNPVKPAPQPTTDPSGAPELVPKQEIYDLEDAYPGVLFKNIGVTDVGDVQVVHLMMYPVQYYPAKNEIELYTKIEVEITYELGAAKAPPMRGAPPTRGGRKRRVPAGYEDQILNFDNI